MVRLQIHWNTSLVPSTIKTKTMWPSPPASKMLISLLLNKLFLVLIYCMFMDTLLFIRIRRYKLDIFDESPDNSSITVSSTRSSSEENYENLSWIPCSFNPLCHPTVKALMIDPINHYIYSPLGSLFDLCLGISKNMLFLSPNMISYFHVLVALVAGKLLTHQSLTTRRIAVILFQLRMVLDDLDGHVARERRNIKGERSEVGTFGYYVDGLCDMFGVIAMVVGLFIYLKNNPPRRGYIGASSSSLPYHQLKEINTSEDIEKDSNTEIGISFRTKVSTKRIIQVICLFSGQMLLSSVMWNRYIDVYQNLLENSKEYDVIRRQTIFRSRIFFTATSFWKLVNPHCYLHLLSIAVFYDKMWHFLRLVYHSGYLALVFAVAASEYFVSDIREFVRNGAL